MNKNFTIEDLENIRIIVGQKTKQIKNNIENFKTKTELNSDKQAKIIEDAEQELATYSLIEAKCMMQIGETILKTYDQ